MTAEDLDRTPSQRDAMVRRTRRLRVGLVSSGVLGSLAVAGGVAAATTPHATPQVSPTQTQQAATDGESFSQWGDDDQQQTQQLQQQTDPWAGQQAPNLQPGTGMPQGQSSGS